LFKLFEYVAVVPDGMTEARALAPLPEIVGAVESPRPESVSADKVGISVVTPPTVFTAGVTDCAITGAAVAVLPGEGVIVVPVGVGGDPPPLQATSDVPSNVLTNSNRRFK
jgi:hypothetical protein